MPADFSLPLPPTPGPGDRPNVYVINSDPAFLEMIGDLLSDVRVSIQLEALRPNIEVTLDNLRSARPDLLILDLVPYQSDGMLLLERVASDAELSAIPVMIACTNPGLAERAANAHANVVRDVLPKPFDLDDFYARLSRLLDGVRVP